MRWFIAPALAGLLITVGGCGPSEQAAAPTDGTPTASSTNAPGEGNAPAESHGSEEAASEDKDAHGTEKAASGGKVEVPNGPWAKVDPSKYQVTESGLAYAVLKEGNGKVAEPGQDVAVHYTGWLKSNGEKFDSSLDRNEPIHFTLGRGNVIPGWDEGVKGMKVGEKRQLVIPSKLGYGETGTPGGPIPGNADLIFDVELVDVHAAH